MSYCFLFYISILIIVFIVILNTCLQITFFINDIRYLINDIKSNNTSNLIQILDYL
jgi:hypothetical protein